MTVYDALNFAIDGFEALYNDMDEDTKMFVNGAWYTADDMVRILSSVLNQQDELMMWGEKN